MQWFVLIFKLFFQFILYLQSLICTGPVIRKYFNTPRLNNKKIKKYIKYTKVMHICMHSNSGKKGDLCTCMSIDVFVWIIKGIHRGKTPADGMTIIYLINSPQLLVLINRWYVENMEHREPSPIHVMYMYEHTSDRGGFHEKLSELKSSSSLMFHWKAP